MRIIRQYILIFLLFLLLSIPAFSEENLTASPARTAKAEFTQPLFMGRDYWYLLKEIWHTLDGVKDEQFVKDAGFHYVKWSTKSRNLHPPRVLYLRHLQFFGANTGKANFKVALEKTEHDTKIYHPEHLSDDHRGTACAVSGSIEKVAKRYQPVEVKLLVRFSSPISLRRLSLNYGISGENPDIGNVSFYQQGKQLLPATQKKDKGLLIATFKDLPKSDLLEIRCQSAPLKYTLQDFPEELQKRLMTRPFDSHLMRPAPFGLQAENFDYESAEKLLQKYEKSHIGICFAEWDSQAFFQSIRPSSRLYSETTEFFGTPPGNREDMFKYAQKFWNWHKSLFFNRIWGMSGATGMAHYGMEWGGSAAGLELTNHTSTIPHRTLLRYTAGAGRQYNKPWLLYLAYFLDKYAPSSISPMPKKHSKSFCSGPDAGISPSFARRIFLTGYFMGNTFQSIEQEPWGHVEKKGNTCVLNANGKILKEFHAFVNSPAGKRGTWYTPILFAIDSHHGMVRDKNVWCWGDQPTVTQTKGDLMSKLFIRAIDPYDGNIQSWDKPPYSHNLNNSSLGDIFDTALGNPPSGNTPVFKNYAAVVLPDDIKITPALSAKLADYVSGGGTLVINSIHQNALAPEMMTAKLKTQMVTDSGLQIPRITPGKTVPVLRTDAGNTLAVKQKYGFGHVIMTLPPYFFGKDNAQSIRYITRLLEKLQKEVMPFQIKGDCQFILSRLAENHWKAAIINNKGVLKKPWERVEKFDSVYTSKIEIKLPANAAASSIYRQRELSKTADGIRFDLPPGEVTVIEIQNAAIPSKGTGLPLLGEWKLDGTPGKVYVGRHKESTFDMKYSLNKKGNFKVYDAVEPQTAVVVDYYPPMQINSGTFEFWAAPDFNAKLSDRGGYPLAGRFFRVAFHQKRWSFNVLDSATMYGPPARHGKWDHLAFTWDKNECHFYVNGKEYTLNGVPLKIYLPIWNGVFNIGTLGRGRRTFGGKISNVKLYSRVLTPEEVNSCYKQSAALYQ